MKKTATFAALALALGFALIPAPAQASDIDTKVTICHSDNGKPEYKLQSVSEDSVVDKDGKAKGHGLDELDVIPAFDYNFGGDAVGHYAGSTLWQSGVYTDTFFANGCNASDNPLTVVPATYAPGTCLNPNGTVTRGLQTDTNVTDSDPLLGAGVWTIGYSKTADSGAQTYSWPAGFTGTQTITIVGPGPGDSLWNTETNSCNMPDTGAGSDLMTIGLVGGGILAGGLALALTKRRRTA